MPAMSSSLPSHGRYAKRSAISSAMRSGMERGPPSTFRSISSGSTWLFAFAIAVLGLAMRIAYTCFAISSAVRDLTASRVLALGSQSSLAQPNVWADRSRSNTRRRTIPSSHLKFRRTARPNCPWSEANLRPRHIAGGSQALTGFGEQDRGMVHLMATNLLAIRDERSIRPDDLQRCRPRRHKCRIDRTDHRG